MYSTCIFCHADLGTNDAIEHFPVGQRLAFDADKGRLWVICGNVCAVEPLAARRALGGNRGSGAHLPRRA